MPPLVSVIIPVYNVKSYLSECIESVINQSYSNLDIIVIDDGSRDGSSIICDYYQKRDARIRVIHQYNAGLSAARNAGLQIMRGTIVAFLDSDDAFLPNMIQIMVEKMIQTKADIVSCDYYTVHSTKKMYIKSSMDGNVTVGVVPSSIALNELIEEKITFFAWNKIYKSYLFSDIVFPNDHVYEGQSIMPQLIQRADKIALINIPLVLYRKRPNSISVTFDEKNTLDWPRARKLMEEFVTENTPATFSERQTARFF